MSGEKDNIAENNSPEWLRVHYLQRNKGNDAVSRRHAQLYSTQASFKLEC